MSTEVDRRTWLHVPSGTLWFNSSDTHQVVKIWIGTSTKMYMHHFKSDSINDMDHMRISGTEPSSVILSKTNYFKKLKSDTENVPKQTEAKRDGVMNPKNYNFNPLETQKIWWSPNATINRSWTWNFATTDLVTTLVLSMAWIWRIRFTLIFFVVLFG